MSQTAATPKEATTPPTPSVPVGPSVVGTNQERELMLRNAGTRRLIIGGRPNQRPIARFDTDADAEAERNGMLPKDKRLGQVHKLEGSDAERVRSSKVVDALKDRLKLQVA